MKISVCSLILALAALTSIAHADDFADKNISCNTIEHYDKNGVNTGVTALSMSSDGQGDFAVNGVDGGKNLSSDPGMIVLNTWGNIFEHKCPGAKVTINLLTGEGTVETKSEQSSGILFGDSCQSTGEGSFTGCKVDK